MNPGHFDASFGLGELYIQQGKLDAAIPYLEKAHQIDPSHYTCGYDLALAYFRTGQFNQARDHIRKMLGRKDVAELHNLLGSVEQQAGDVLAAAKAMQRAAEMEPTEKYIFDYGSILLTYRAYDGALKILRYGSEKYPRSAQLKVGLGTALYSRGHYDEAVEALCAAVDLDPSDPRPLFFLGKMHDVSPAMAEEVTRRLANFARLYPNNAAANYYYALSLWKGKPGQETSADTEQVETLLKKAISLDNGFHEAHYQLGVLYEQAQRFPDAVREYERAVQLNPNFDRAYYRLARAYRRTGQKDRAQKSFAAYERLHAEKQTKKEEQPLELTVR